MSSILGLVMTLATLAVATMIFDSSRAAAQSTNNPPAVALHVTPNEGVESTVFTASMDGTYDPDGDAIASYEICWGDSHPEDENAYDWETCETGPSATHKYNQTWDYVVTATATDARGATWSETQVVRVCSSFQGDECVQPPCRSYSRGIGPPGWDCYYPSTDSDSASEEIQKLLSGNGYVLCLEPDMGLEINRSVDPNYPAFAATPELALEEFFRSTPELTHLASAGYFRGVALPDYVEFIHVRSNTKLASLVAARFLGGWVIEDAFMCDSFLRGA